MSTGKSSDFIVFLNFDLSTFFDASLPFSAKHRPYDNFGNPYRIGTKPRGNTTAVKNLDFVGLLLWSLNSSRRQYALCPIFELVPTSVNVRLDYSLNVLCNVRLKKKGSALEVK